MAAGDLQVVTIKRGLEGVVVPSKVYDILANGRPIAAVASERTEIARLVRQYECGIVADPDDPNQAGRIGPRHPANSGSKGTYEQAIPGVGKDV